MTAASRWLVTGAGGMLGRELVTVLAAHGADVTALARAELDVTRPTQVAEAVDGHDVVLNAAAWTAVDLAEEQEAAAYAVNATGAANVAAACARSGARLVHVSTDYVFDGQPVRDGEPYAEDVVPAPRSAYGRGKAAGEWAVRALLPERSAVARTAWLYGEHGPSFVSTMLRLERERPTVDVVDDQWGQPTWAADLARQLVALGEALADGSAPAGIYHASASGRTTWFDLARRVFALAGADPERVHATTSAAFVRPAPRPAWSVLGHEGWAGTPLAPMRPWDEALEEAFPSLARASA